jgi:hypothetical protein
VTLIAGRNVWDGLGPIIDEAVHRRAAVAYAGKDAPRLLRLSLDDDVIVDGSDTALSAGVTSPDALAEWLEAGVNVWSLQDLHAKVVLLAGADGARTALVGSANASVHANVDLFEAVAVSGDAELCDRLEGQLDGWTALAELVDRDWIRQARTVYRPARRARRTGPRPVRLVIDERQPLWIGDYSYSDDPQPAAVIAHTARIQQQFSTAPAEVWTWTLPDQSLDRIRPGQNVVAVERRNFTRKPTAQAPVYQPSRVVRVDRQNRTVFLVADPGQHTVAFTDVARAVRESGAALEWNTDLPPAAAAAVYRLWHRPRR